MTSENQVPQVYTDVSVDVEPDGPFDVARLVIRKRGVEVILLEAAATDPSRPRRHTGHRLSLPHAGVELGGVVTGVHVSATRLHIGLMRDAASQLGLPAGDRRLVCHVVSMSATPESVRNAVGLVLGEGPSSNRLTTLIDSGIGSGPDSRFGVFLDAYAPVGGDLAGWRGR